MRVSNFSDSTLPLVTIIMPVYGVRDYIMQAVNSVLNQTYRHFELLIVDDESPDDSIDLVTQNTRDPRIRIHRQQNRGLAGARNSGIRHAKGKYIAFLDSDDFWHPVKLETQMKVMLNQAVIGVCFSASMFVNSQGKPINRIQTPKLKSGYTAKEVFCRNPIGNGSAPIIRKAVLEQIAFHGKNKYGHHTSYLQYFDESLKQSEDIDCWTRIALFTGTEFSLIDRPLTYYRLNDMGLSADVKKQLETWEIFYRKLERDSPEFIVKYGSTARAFQYRYLARRCLSQAQGKEALTLMVRSIATQPMALLSEAKKTMATLVASVVFSLLSYNKQKKLIGSLLR